MGTKLVQRSGRLGFEIQVSVIISASPPQPAAVKQRPKYKQHHHQQQSCSWGFPDIFEFESFEHPPISDRPFWSSGAAAKRGQCMRTACAKEVHDNPSTPQHSPPSSMTITIVISSIIVIVIAIEIRITIMDPSSGLSTAAAPNFSVAVDRQRVPCQQSAAQVDVAVVWYRTLYYTILSYSYTRNYMGIIVLEYHMPASWPSCTKSPNGSQWQAYSILVQLRIPL